MVSATELAPIHFLLFEVEDVVHTETGRRRGLLGLFLVPNVPDFTASTQMET